MSYDLSISLLCVAICLTWIYAAYKIGQHLFGGMRQRLLVSLVFAITCRVMAGIPLGVGKMMKQIHRFAIDYSHTKVAQESRFVSNLTEDLIRLSGNFIGDSSFACLIATGILIYAGYAISIGFFVYLLICERRERPN